MIVLQPLIHSINNFNWCFWIIEHRCTDLDCIGTCHHHFDCILPFFNAAHADNRNLHAVCYLPYHSYRYREYCRTGQTTHIVLEDWTAGIDINSHTEQGVDQRYCICTLCLNCLCNRSNIGYIRREFYDHWFFRIFANFFYNVSCIFTAGTERNTALFYVWTGDVQLKHINFTFAQTLCNCTVILNAAACNIRDLYCILGCKVWHIMFEKMLHTRILQTNRVEHAARSFGNSRWRVAQTLFKGHTF